jgi:hypothetical protein
VRPEEVRPEDNRKALVVLQPKSALVYQRKDPPAFRRIRPDRPYQGMGCYSRLGGYW